MEIETNKPEDQTTPAAPPPPPAPSATPELTERIDTLEASLAERDTSLATAVAENETLKKSIADLTTAHNAAVTEYRKLAVSSNPIFTADMLVGDTIPAINAAMTRITELAATVRSKIEADIKAISVPAGAPERDGPDTSGLSPRDKIKYAVENKK